MTNHRAVYGEMICHVTSPRFPHSVLTAGNAREHMV
jgi:hypothetical protein